jgi:hypothetical protein
MKRVGILAGREQTFPESIIKALHERGNGLVEAEMIKVGGIRLNVQKKYDVIIDRISHEVPYYRAMLKRLALEGTYIINNPFWWSADDKFFNYLRQRSAWRSQNHPCFPRKNISRRSRPKLA